MEAVLSKLHCRAVHSLAGEKPGTGFEQTLFSDLSIVDKPERVTLSTETAGIGAVLSKSFAKRGSADPKDVKYDAVSSDDVQSLAAHKVTAVQEDNADIKEEREQSNSERHPPAITESATEEQCSKLVEDLQKANCDKVSDQPVAERNRSSRRKPQKTHRILESEETEGAIFQKYLDEDLRDYMLVGPGSAESYLCSDSALPSADIRSKIDDENPVVDEENIVLPEGTVFVQPEAADASPQYLEVESSRSKKVFRGNLDSAIIHCTACNRQIGLDGFLDIHRHPVLKVLICRKCYSLYNDLEVEQDAEGSDEQCRWCGQGGDLVCCDFCHNALCKGCIRRNLGRKELGAILSAEEGVKWKCYVCDPKPLLNLIEHCTSIMEALTKQEKRQQELENKRKRTDARSKAAAGSLASNSENSIHGQPVSVIRAPSVSVMGRSLLKQTAAKTESLQKSQTYTTDVGRVKDPSASSAFTHVAHSAIRTAPTKNGTIFVALPPGTGTSRDVSHSGPKISLMPVNDQSLLQILDRLLSATHSMGMFLASLRDDLRRTCGASVVFNATQMQRRREIATKLWRAYNSYNKSLKEGTLQTSETVRKTNNAAKVLLKAGSSVQNKAEVIELSDSDEDTRSAGQKAVQQSGSRPQRVIVGTNSKADAARGSVATEFRPTVLSKEAQPSEVVSTQTNENRRSACAAVGNRRKRKQPQHFLNVEEIPKKILHTGEDSEDNETRATERRDKRNEELKNDKKLEDATERKGGVLCIEIGDDLEEVMHKIANGSCSSIEFSTNQAKNAEIKMTEERDIVDWKRSESREGSEVNGHVNSSSNNPHW